MIKISTIRRNFYLIFFNVVLVATRGKNTLILHLHVSTSSVWTKNDPLLFHEKKYIADITHISGVIIRNNVQFHANRCFGYIL